MQDDGVASSPLSCETPDPNEHNSKANDCRYSGDARSSETCISCPQAKSLIFFPSRFLLDISANKEATKVSCLHLRRKDLPTFLLY